MKVIIEAEDHELEQLQELFEGWIRNRVEEIIKEKETTKETNPAS